MRGWQQKRYVVQQSASRFLVGLQKFCTTLQFPPTYDKKRHNYLIHTWNIQGTPHTTGRFRGYRRPCVNQLHITMVIAQEQTASQTITSSPTNWYQKKMSGSRTIDRQPCRAKDNGFLACQGRSSAPTVYTATVREVYKTNTSRHV
jgi:hypothetical protein